MTDNPVSGNLIPTVFCLLMFYVVFIGFLFGLRSFISFIF